MSVKKPGFVALALGSVGVVYGDIGTSPLYAFRESVGAAIKEGAPVQPDVVLGVLSLIFWTIVLMVTCKYVLLLLKADNKGEGGILSLMALAQGAMKEKSKYIILLGMMGAALFYGDAIITPAISVLSALEGLKLVTKGIDPFIMPVAIAVMIILFTFQYKGTEKVAKFFGPIMVVWFLALAVGGLNHILDSPIVWNALNPYYGINFMFTHGYAALIALGAVFLAVTGAEALYADMGHFGRRPIKSAWIFFVMPCLVLNYFGQAALVLAHPELAHESFFRLYPEWALLPMVILATFATVIAAQAVITGAFSLTQQAIQLGLLPRMHISFTSHSHSGQIYIHKINWLLFVGVILLIEIFHTSSALASAYGIAVTGTMCITAILLFLVMRYVWKWKLLWALSVFIPFFIIDLTFLGANLTKLFHGGFVPVMLAFGLSLMMTTWMKGVDTLRNQERTQLRTIDELLRNLKTHPPKTVGGTAVFLNSNVSYAPAALLLNLQHNKIIHEANILLTLNFTNAPYLEDKDRVKVKDLGDGFTHVFMAFGYMEHTDVMDKLHLVKEKGVAIDISNTTFFISRRNIIPSAKFGMPLWQDRIFILMANNASDAADYFHIPLNRVVEMGVQMTV